MPKQGPDSCHVVPSKNGGWDVVHRGRVISHHRTKQLAENAARKFSRQQGTELRIHNKDGKISRSDSHGNDPRNIKG